MLTGPPKGGEKGLEALVMRRELVLAGDDHIECVSRVAWWLLKVKLSEFIMF